MDQSHIEIVEYYEIYPKPLFEVMYVGEFEKKDAGYPYSVIYRDDRIPVVFLDKDATWARQHLWLTPGQVEHRYLGAKLRR